MITKPFRLIAAWERRRSLPPIACCVLGCCRPSSEPLDPGFYGGPEVQALEKEAAERFGVKHVVSVNSWTSGLVAAMGAIGLEPGDEVIVTPWTMVATATAILHWNAIPVFADIDPKTFNLDPKGC